MKTPEEFKKPFETCPRGEDCVHCDCTIEECAAIQREQALAYIQQLEAQVPRWISVEERLPESNEEVAIIITDDDCTYLRVGWHRKEGQWMQAGWGVVERKVTHWMPLPEAPEEHDHAAD